jgi:hypothetical protein
MVNGCDLNRGGTKVIWVFSWSSSPFVTLLHLNQSHYRTAVGQILPADLIYGNYRSWRLSFRTVIIYNEICGRMQKMWMELRLNHYIKRYLELDGIFWRKLGAMRLDGVWFQDFSSLHSFRHQARRMSILKVINFIFSKMSFQKAWEYAFYLKNTCRISIKFSLQ